MILVIAAKADMQSGVGKVPIQFVSKKYDSNGKFMEWTYPVCDTDIIGRIRAEGVAVSGSTTDRAKCISREHGRIGKCT